VVGDTQNYPHEIPGDIDIVVDEQSIPKIHENLFRFCNERGARIVQILQHERSAWYFVFVWSDVSGHPCFLHPDICADYFRRGRLFLRAHEILAGRSKSTDGEGNAFYVPAPANAFIYYLLKKIDKCDLSERQSHYLSVLWKKDPQSAFAQIGRFWPDREASLLARAAATNTWVEVKAELPRFQRTLRGGLSFSTQHLWQEVNRKISRIRRPTGLMVTLMGGDGAGKSTVLSRVEQHLAPAFRRTRRYHLRPHFGQASGDGAPVTSPHAKPRRGWLFSFAKLAVWWMDYTLGYLSDVFPRLVRSTLVLFDRYYYDLTVDSKRYRYGGPLWLATLVGNFIPRPDLIILLDAPGEVLHARKQEIPLAETIRQQADYRRLVRVFRGGRIVNVSRPLDEVVTEVDQVILDFMALRTAQRFRPEEKHRGT
jgi:thymidylate kinase